MTATDRLVFVDIETTGLDPARHQIWEIGVVIREDGRPDFDTRWLIKPDLAQADSRALQISGYYERTAHMKTEDWSGQGQVAKWCAERFSGATLVGACPWFDSAFLEGFLRRHGHCPAWAHRLVDVESMTVAALGRHPSPGGLRGCADALGVAYDKADLHTALGDARLARAVYDEVMRPDPSDLDVDEVDGDQAALAAAKLVAI